MKKRLFNIISLIMIAVMLPTSSGIGIYQHICSVDNISKFSLFTPENCHEEETSCECCEGCETENNIDINSQEDNFENCIKTCQNLFYYFHLNGEYLINKDDKKADWNKNPLVKISYSLINIQQFKEPVRKTLARSDFKLPSKFIISFLIQNSSSKQDDSPAWC